MYGNVLNNTQIKRLMNKQIQISGFDPKKLKLAHYPLTAGGIIPVAKTDVDGRRIKNLDHDLRKLGQYTFEPNEYAVVEINEFINLEEGIVGHFIPASILIDQGFGLTAGKIDPGYGELEGRRQQIRFGLKNLRDVKNPLKTDQDIAHIYFIDLRGLNNDGYSWELDRLKRALERDPAFERAKDDGVDYKDGKS